MCRRNGVTIRSTADCLIAQIAIEHDLDLLHDDRDFDRMARVVHELKVAEELMEELMMAITPSLLTAAEL